MDKTIGAAAFKAQCLALIEEVATTGKPITVTKRGKPRVVVSAAPPPTRRKSIFDYFDDRFALPDDYDVDAELNAVRREMAAASEAKWDRLYGPAPARHERGAVAERAKPKARKRGSRGDRKGGARG
jgi:prevent-host-death family protein